MTGPQPPDNGPFDAREQAEAVFGHMPRGMADYLADTIDHYPGVEFGQYDRELVDRIAATFDAADVAVIASWIYRVMRDIPDNQPDPEGHR